ncbi:MAG: beta-galactosidase [Tyzzerella sp.]|nr:beta-galactosidase [Tyzzerella sp.]
MRRYINDKFPHFMHGADYNPEQWLHMKEIWDEDMKLMKEANCNEMSVGIFSWATLEPEEGKYDFSFLDEIIDKVYKNGGRVVLATPSGARPRWLAEKYPEVLRVREDGHRKRFGARHNHCYSSPAYREKVRQINTKLAERYGKHPAVVAWHISNEYGGKCYCELCEKEFREFLRKRYDNDIEKLNLAYWSYFWSHKYNSFDEIEFPGEHGENSIHGLNLDFRRFVSYQTKDFMNAEIDAIRAVCPDIPVTTNMMPGYYYLNYYELAEKLDVISWDSYPNWHNGTQLSVASETAFWHDFFRTLKNRPFMLMESAPGLVNWKPYNKLKRPGMDRLASIQAIAHGSDTVQYFQWRKSRGSVEKFHGAVVDHVGTSETRVFKAVQSTGATLKAIDEVCGSMVNARVAIIYDWENRWALDDSQGFARNEKKYSKTCLDYYKALWKRGITVDVINAHGNFEKYDLVIAPMLYMTDHDTIERIETYVGNGGTFYATYMLGMVNETDLCYLGGYPAENLKEVFGIWNEEIDTLYPGEKVEIVSGDKAYEGMDYSELIHAKEARVLAAFNSEFYAGMPAATVNCYGKGKAYYQAFRDTGEFWDDMLDKILVELNIQPTLKSKVPEGVCAHKREADGVEYLFVQNYSDKAVGDIDVGDGYVDMESGEAVSTVSLNTYDVRILKK